MLSVLLLGSIPIGAYAQTGEIENLAAVFTVDDNTQKVNWWQTEEEYFLFLPADTPYDTAVLELTATAGVTMGETEIKDGDLLSVFPVGEKVSLACGSQTYSLTVLQSANIPSLHITTESGSMDAVHADKSHKEPATVAIFSDGALVMEKELDYIKGRGNATWQLDKKPYNIKFDKKTDLFGMGKAKKWSLLANYLDKSLIRNSIAFDLADELGLQYTSQSCFVDLYVDNVYYGNYLLCESVEVGETRVDIFDLEGATEDANEGLELDELPLGGNHTVYYPGLTEASQKWVEIPNDPEDISGGYLLEFEILFRYIDEVSGFVTSHQQGVVLKSPEYASEAQVKYIAALYQDFEDAVYSPSGYNAKGKHYSEYIDMESFVRMYVFQEYVKNFDAGITSFYLYKDAGDDKFYAAPVWDFDNALGKTNSRYDLNLQDADGWWASIAHYVWDPQQYVPTVLNLLFKHDDFFVQAANVWNEELNPILSEEKMQYYLQEAERISASAAMNSILWDLFKKDDFDKSVTAYMKYCTNTLFPFMKNRKAFLDEGFSDMAVRVFFDANGGTGAVFNTKALHLGDNYTLPASTFTNGDLFFKEWNTEADGSGTSYKPGETCFLRDPGTTFYAQWTDVDPSLPTEEDFPRLKNLFDSILLLLNKAAAKLSVLFKPSESV